MPPAPRRSSTQYFSSSVRPTKESSISIICYSTPKQTTVKLGGFLRGSSGQAPQRPSIGRIKRSAQHLGFYASLVLLCPFVALIAAGGSQSFVHHQIDLPILLHRGLRVQTIFVSGAN